MSPYILPSKVILQWLRHRRLVLPPSLPPESVSLVADCYCLAPLLALLAPPPIPPSSPLDSTLSRLLLVRLCDQGQQLADQIPDSTGGKWVCTSCPGTRSPVTGEVVPGPVPYLKLGPLLEDDHDSRTDIRLRSRDCVLGIDTSFGAKLCLTQGNDTNIWANRFGLVLNLHHLEYITWVSCDIGSLPASALTFSKTQSGLCRYLGFIREGLTVVLGWWWRAGASG